MKKSDTNGEYKMIASEQKYRHVCHSGTHLVIHTLASYGMNLGFAQKDMDRNEQVKDHV